MNMQYLLLLWFIILPSQVYLFSKPSVGNEINLLVSNDTSNTYEYGHIVKNNTFIIVYTYRTMYMYIQTVDVPRSITLTLKNVELPDFKSVISFIISLRL